MKLFAKYPTLDRGLEIIQNNIAACFADLQDQFILKNQLIDVIIAAPDTDVIVNHRLGRRYQAYATHGQDQYIRIKESATPNTQPDRQIIIQGDAAANIKLFIY